MNHPFFTSPFHAVYYVSAFFCTRDIWLYVFDSKIPLHTVGPHIDKLLTWEYVWMNIILIPLIVAVLITMVLPWIVAFILWFRDFVLGLMRTQLKIESVSLKLAISMIEHVANNPLKRNEAIHILSTDAEANKLKT